MNKSALKVLLVAVVALVLYVAVTHMASSPVFSGLLAYAPLAAVLIIVGFGLAYSKQIGRWIFPPATLLLCLSSCTTIGPDEIGVWVVNYGKSPEDYSVVMGKAPYDNAVSTWLKTFPAKEMSSDIPEKEIPTKNGILFTVDPALSFALDRSDESCRKYAFKFAAYQSPDAFQQAVTERVNKAARDAIVNVLGGMSGDSLLFARAAAEKRIEDNLRKSLIEEFGINLTQYSVVIKPTESLQQAIDQRLVAEQALNTERAKLAASEVQAQVRLNEAKGLTPQILEKYRIDAEITKAAYDYNAKVALANSQNSKIIVATSDKVPIISGN